MNAITCDKKKENQHSSNGVGRRDMLIILRRGQYAKLCADHTSTALTKCACWNIDFTSKELTQRAPERRAVEAAICGMPIVNFEAMRQAFLRDAKAMYGDIIFWSRPVSWKLQWLTPNTHGALGFLVHKPEPVRAGGR